MKPKIFIGSSSEDKKIAEAIHYNLCGVSQPVIWSESLVTLTRSTLENLMEAINTFDFAIFVLSPNDMAIIRDENKPAARDNIIFEIGLFMGSIGRDRVFFVKPQSAKDMRIPTDLMGITYGTYDSEHFEIKSALLTFCNQVKEQIKGKPILEIPEHLDGMMNLLSDKVVLITPNYNRGIMNPLDTYSLCVGTTNNQTVKIKFSGEINYIQTPETNVWFYYTKIGKGWKISEFDKKNHTQEFNLKPNSDGEAILFFKGTGKVKMELFINSSTKPYISKTLVW